MHFIDHTVEEPTVMQRQVSTIQDADDPSHSATCHEDSRELNEAADEDTTIDNEKKKREVTKQTETVFQSCPMECTEKHDRLKDLVLPSSPTCRIDVDSREEARGDGREGKTIYVNIASGDEAEHEAEAKQVKARCLVSGRIRTICGRDRCVW